jgi:hypothetical protein
MADLTHYRLRLAVVVAPVAVALGAMVFVPPIGQRQAYHDFADTRVVLGIPYFGDVITNVGCVIVGVGGLLVLARGRRGASGSPVGRCGMWPYGTFFAGMVLVGLGSGWYHLEPTNDSLLWDRLAMAVAFMGLFCAVIAERISLRVGVGLLPVLVAGGLASVVYWYLTERAGMGDLRMYVIVQSYPVLAIPLMMLLFPVRYTHGRYLWGTIGWYLVAKVFEGLDRPIYAWTLGVVSGHNLKHVATAVAAGCVVIMLHRRRPIGED